MKFGLFAATSLAAIGMASAALAQDTPSEEIIVVGQKTARTLQDTQASVAVVTGADIESRGLENFRDAFRTMSNVMDADWLDAGFVIRGVNSEGLTPGGAPLASLYIDGAQQTTQGSRRGSRGLWDVQQVEVYRGPQSTLSGRASLAGAIYVETRDPTFDWDASARATYAELDTQEGAISFGGPIVDDLLAFRIAGEYQRRDSEISYPLFQGYNLYDDLIEDEYWQLRGKLLFTPTSRLRAVLSVSTAEDSPAYDDVAGPLFGFEYSDRRGDFNAPYFQEVRSGENNTGSLEISYELSDTLTLTSLSALTDSTMDRPSVNAGTPGEIYVNLGGEDETALTQEVRLNYEGEALQAVAGIYYAHEESETQNRRTTPFSGGRLDGSNSARESDNFALFGEATWRFQPRWRLVAGGRIDVLDQSITSSFFRNYDNPAFTDTSSSSASSFEETTILPKAGLIYDLAEDQTLGFTVQRGFRSGGSAIDFTGTPYTFDPEYTWNYEVSYRGQFGPTTVSANVFHTDWTDQQVELQLVPGDFTTQVIRNAGESRLDGFEVEARTRFTPELTGFASVGYLDTEFEDFNVVTLGDFSGLPFPESPEWSLSLGADWEGASGFFAGFDTKYMGRYLARDLQNAPVDELGEYWVSNLRFGYQAAAWRLTAFADNAFDEEYLTYRDVSAFGDCCATIGRGRVAGVTLQVSY
jgi:outer membrane receptor protein involved in Fe transport